MLVSQSPHRLGPFLLKHRNIALALAFNLPGNSLAGSGGGLSLAAGIGGLFALVAFVATSALAVAPLPLFIFLTGYQP